MTIIELQDWLSDNVPDDASIRIVSHGERIKVTQDDLFYEEDSNTVIIAPERAIK